MLIQKALNDATRQLASVSSAPQLDARWLLLHVLEQHEARLRSAELRRGEASWLLAHGDERLGGAARHNFDRLLHDRMAGVPLAYLLGWQEFYGRRFKVTRDVLIPRPSTEELIDETLRYLTSPPTVRAIEEKTRPFAIVDIGTGSGCIAVTLALELASFNSLLSRIQYTATDVSPTALEVARENARQHGVLDRIDFLEGDMLEPLVGREIDLIVSNPPYVPTEALAQADRAVDTAGLAHEPRLALDGGPDGQRFVDQLLNQEIPVVFETTGGALQTHRIQ